MSDIGIVLFFLIITILLFVVPYPGTSTTRGFAAAGALLGDYQITGANANANNAL